jgi:hypothetical protein
MKRLATLTDLLLMAETESAAGPVRLDFRNWEGPAGWLLAEGGEIRWVHCGRQRFRLLQHLVAASGINRDVLAALYRRSCDTNTSLWDALLHRHLIGPELLHRSLAAYFAEAAMELAPVLDDSTCEISPVRGATEACLAPFRFGSAELLVTAASATGEGRKEAGELPSCFGELVAMPETQWTSVVCWRAVDASDFLAVPVALTDARGRSLLEIQRVFRDALAPNVLDALSRGSVSLVCGSSACLLAAREGDFTVIASFHQQEDAAHAAGHLLIRLKSAA